MGGAERVIKDRLRRKKERIREEKRKEEEKRRETERRGENKEERLKRLIEEKEEEIEEWKKEKRWIGELSNFINERAVTGCDSNMGGRRSIMMAIYRIIMSDMSSDEWSDLRQDIKMLTIDKQKYITKREEMIMKRNRYNGIWKDMEIDDEIRDDEMMVIEKIDNDTWKSIMIV